MLPLSDFSYIQIYILNTKHNTVPFKVNTAEKMNWLGAGLHSLIASWLFYENIAIYHHFCADLIAKVTRYLLHLMK